MRLKQKDREAKRTVITFRGEAHRGTVGATSVSLFVISAIALLSFWSSVAIYMDGQLTFRCSATPV